MQRPALDCYVITLGKRSPENWDKFLERNSASGLAFQAFEAIDGREVSEADAIDAKVLLPGAQHYTPGALGCAMSHLSLWRRCLAGEQPIMVFEDDAYIRRDFSSAIPGFPDDWDFVMFGCNTDSVLETAPMCGVSFGGLSQPQHLSPEQLARFACDTSPVALLRLN